MFSGLPAVTFNAWLLGAHNRSNRIQMIHGILIQNEHNNESTPVSIDENRRGFGPELRICLARTLTGGAAYGSGSVLAVVDFVILPRHGRPYRISNNGQ